MILCKHCSAPLLTGTKSCAACGKPVPRNRKSLFFTIGGVVFVLFVVAALLPRKQPVSAVATLSGGTGSVYVPPATRNAYYVTYGVDTGAHVTYTNEQGGIQQETVSGGWSKTFTMRPGNSASISAQIDSEYSDNITVAILVDGQPFRTSTSSGRFAVASARGVCCSK